MEEAEEMVHWLDAVTTGAERGKEQDIQPWCLRRADVHNMLWKLQKHNIWQMQASDSLPKMFEFSWQSY